MEEISVTVGIPSYNSGRYIRDCLSSILNQTYKNIEVIIVDNGSTDDTEKIVFSFRDSRVKFYRNPENIYCYGSYNVIINLAKTEFLAIYHSDDIYKPTIIEQQVKFLQEYRNVMAVFTEADIINADGKVIGEWKIPKDLADIFVLNFRLAFNKMLKYGDFLICPSCMFVKNVFRKVGDFKDEKFFSKTDDSLWLELLEKYGMQRNIIFTANDLEMWFRILQKFPVGILQKKLMRYRIHPGQGSFSGYSTSAENFFIVMDYYEKYAREKNFLLLHYWKNYRAKKIRWKFSIAQDALVHSDFKKARERFVSFIKEFHLIFPVLTIKDFLRFCWALSVVLFALYDGFFKKILEYYLSCKRRNLQKRMNLP